jgi:hypothetical protein
MSTRQINITGNDILAGSESDASDFALGDVMTHTDGKAAMQMVGGDVDGTEYDSSDDFGASEQNTTSSVKTDTTEVLCAEGDMVSILKQFLISGEGSQGTNIASIHDDILNNMKINNEYMGRICDALEQLAIELVKR